MLLTKEEVQAITLNAKSVHKYADQAFFPAEINEAGKRIGDQPFLNFFVRYHHRHAPEQYSWSRLRRVLLLEDVMTAHKPDTAPVVTSPTIEWRGKIFWICFAVEPVQPRSSSSAAPNETVKEEIVTLPQLSNTVPREDEVLAFCAASANQRPTEVYADGVLGEAPVAPPVLLDSGEVASAAQLVAQDRLPHLEGVESVNQAPPPAAALNPRAFVPTPRQVELLRQYKTQHLAQHQWTEDEIEESKVLRQRYCSMGVATAPVRTVTYMQHHHVEGRKQQQQPRHALGTSSSAGAATRGLNASQAAELDLAEEPASSMAAESGDVFAATHTQRSTLSAVAPSSPSGATSATDTPLSPFLPRSVLRAQQQQHASASLALNQHAPAEDPSSILILGDGASASYSQLSVSQTPPPEMQAQASLHPGSLTALSQHLSQLREAEESFYQYISEDSRSAYLNRLADITKRNSETNTRNRRRGIANERRLERKGNLLESCGLWITDDKERASKAEDYVKAQAGDSSSTRKNDESTTVASAVAGGGAAGDGADTAKSAEDVFVERFKAYYSAQRITFADCADSDLFADGNDADIGPLLHAAAVVFDASPESDKADSPSSTGAVTEAMRLGRRPVRRLLPNRLRTEESTPALVQAQLVHRSTVRMAKRAREE
ncbi:conserved hypothetical protein [Leishmania major strain Friedlin]|uniref:Uncharacterized protein n=1 Tax=Leishmania major TaxID=5664 RepID=Q4QFP6_LEIMA|nr:conserved hypothetical protein [Leishmania major strain Friedlin]CAG9571278.1 hypothetical_protein_-_conserved [Leishmania major strain Friedlin]CAJ03107.1 conserved hypothetical protein [Leishmania major strain Friedlin]|eukprot:XP_001687688.1 conserved hypothetical protein [Leishmania major strain Friedlin]